MAHIVQRTGKSGTTWQVRWEHPEDGRGYGHNAGRDRRDADDCKAWIEWRDGSVRPDHHGLRDRVYVDGVTAEPVRTSEAISFRDLAHKWCYEKRPRANPQTKDTYWSRIMQMGELESVPDLLDKPVGAITNDDLSAVLSELQEDHAANTIIGYFTCLKGVFKLAEKRGLIATSPYDKEDHQVLADDPADEVDKYLTADEVQVIVRLAKPDSRDMIEFLYETGFRVGEMLALQVGDCLFTTDPPTIHLQRHLLKRGNRPAPGTKSKKRGYKAVMSPRAEEILRNRCAGKPLGSWVFPPPQSRQAWAYTSWLVHRFLPAVEAATAEELIRSRAGGINIHLLRHSCAVRLLESGATVYDVMEQFGHNNIKTTEKYYAKYSRGQKIRLRAIMGGENSTTDAVVLPFRPASGQR